MIKRRVVNIMAGIELICPYGPVVGKSQILGVNKFQGERGRCNVLQNYLPEPGVGMGRKDKANEIFYPIDSA